MMQVVDRSHPRMRSHIFWSLLGVSIAVLVTVTVVAALVVQRGLLSSSEQNLKQDCQLFAAILDESADPVAMVAALPALDMRVTLIGADGDVVYDSTGSAEGMENHADRPEVRQAFETGMGFSTRESSTLLTVAQYGACLLENGQVVRLSVTRDGVLAVLADISMLALVLAAVMVVACACVAHMLARRLVAPLNAVDPSHPLEERTGAPVYAEVVPLLRRIDEQHTQIEKQMLSLTDIDRMRVEFTANVTHELKTPLTVLSGYAELIETGIAAPEDVQGFAGRIHTEAQHLTALVNDILTLSRMDEAERIDQDYGVFEPVDLRRVCDSVAGRLAKRSDELGVSMEVESAGEVVATGIPKLVDQIVYNLCDNALRYNRPGGSVAVRCGVAEGGRPYVRVSDTGIGIAQENQEKVFNRFFRVDAGRSRETGGTGLGLAIVKHAARCHDADLAIESELGVGTTITVVFHAVEDDSWRA